MPTGNPTLYNSGLLSLLDNTFDWVNDDFCAVRLTSGYTPVATHTEFADISLYAIGTHLDMSAKTAVDVSGVTQLKANNLVFSGVVTFRYIAIVKSKVSSLNSASKLVGYILMDTTPADVEFIRISWASSGVFNFQEGVGSCAGDCIPIYADLTEMNTAIGATEIAECDVAYVTAEAGYYVNVGGTARDVCTAGAPGTMPASLYDNSLLFAWRASEEYVHGQVVTSEKKATPTALSDAAAALRPIDLSPQGLALDRVGGPTWDETPSSNATRSLSILGGAYYTFSSTPYIFECFHTGVPFTCLYQGATLSFASNRVTLHNGTAGGTGIVFIVLTSGRIQWGMDGASGFENVTTLPGTVATINTLYNVAVVCEDGATVDLYFNDMSTPDRSKVFTGWRAPGTPATTSMRLGKYTGTGGETSLDLTGMMMFDRALNEEELNDCFAWIDESQV